MINMICCMSKNRVIGHKGQLPWRFREDLKHFRNKTIGNTVVMGHKTFSSVGVLPGRETLVMTRDTSWGYRVSDIQKLAKDQEVFIAGGEQIYRAFIGLADRMFLTVIHLDVKGDTYFPTFNPDDWEVVKAQRGNRHSYIELERQCTLSL